MSTQKYVLVHSEAYSQLRVQSYSIFQQCFCSANGMGAVSNSGVGQSDLLEVKETYVHLVYMGCIISGKSGRIGSTM